MKSFLNVLLGSESKHDIKPENHKPSYSPFQKAGNGMTDHTPNVPSTPPKVVSGTVAEKAELAKWLVNTYIKAGSVSLPFVLERMLDVRFCSLTAYYLSLEFFSSYGATFTSESLRIAESVGLQPERMPSGRIADVGQTCSMIMPAKYRGYGSPLNSPNSRGHLFQINLCAFVEKNPVIGYQDWLGGDIVLFKGMKPCGNYGGWKLFELDPNSTDDMTAVFMNTSRTNLQIELAHFVEGEEKPRMIYRYSSISGEPIEDRTKDYDNVN